MSINLTFQGNPMTLEGTTVKTGDHAPEFTGLTRELKEESLSDYKEKIKIITSFPSVDTPVCDLQVKAFNKEAASLSGDVEILGVSMDLPFAHARFCESFRIDKVHLLSDYKYHSFAHAYGLMIKELQLIARTIIIVDKEDKVRYVQIVPEVAQEPDYKDALEFLKTIK